VAGRQEERRAMTKEKRREGRATEWEEIRRERKKGELLGHLVIYCMDRYSNETAH